MALRNRIGWLLFVPLLCWLAACAPAARLPALTAVPLAISPQGAAGRDTQAPFTAVPATQAPPITTARPSPAAPKQPAETAIPVPAPNVPTLATVTPAPPFPTRTIDLDTLDRLQLVGTIGYGGAQAAAIAPDGRLLAAGTTAGLALFELPGFRPLRFDLVDGGVDAVAISLDGAIVAASHQQSDGEETELRSLASNRRLGQVAGGSPRFLPGGQLLATLAGGDTRQPITRLWRLAGFERVAWQFPSLPALDPLQVVSAAGGHAMAQAATISFEQQATDPITRTLDRDVTALAFSPSGQVLAAGDAGGTVRLLSTADGAASGEYQLGSAEVRLLAFSPDAGLLGALGANGTAYVWRIGQPQPFAKLAADAGDTRLIFSADNQLALVGGPSGVRVFSLPGGTLLHNLAIASQDIAIGPRRRLLALVHDGAIQLWGVP